MRQQPRCWSIWSLARLCRTKATVRVLGRDTAAITTGDDWLASLDRFGIVSPRAVLIEAATIEENLAMPFTLQIDPIPPDVAAQVSALAAECGIPADALKQTTGEASPAVRTRLHFARALAPQPALLLLEHPTAALPDAAQKRVLLMMCCGCSRAAA